MHMPRHSAGMAHNEKKAEAERYSAAVTSINSPNELPMEEEEEEEEEEISGKQDVSSRRAEKDSHSNEEDKRIRYQAMKSEIMDTINLHTLINHKEIGSIQKELNRIDAQLKLLQKLHNDENLLDQVEEYEVAKKKLLEQQMDYSLNTTASGYMGDLSSLQNYTFSPGPHSFAIHSNSKLHNPTYHYQTRSKSHANIADGLSMSLHSKSLDSNLKLLNPVPLSASSSINVINQSSTHSLPQLNSHHKRNYSSNCVSSNSGVVGYNEDNKPIFRRYDGILIIITCSFCQRSGFSSAQGIVNHTRLKHSKTYSSQPLAILFNQRILPDDKQDPKILANFKELDKDPEKEYLPCDVVISKKSKKGHSKHYATSPKSVTGGNTTSYIVNNGSLDARSTLHLEKLYGKEDFKNLVEMVKDAPRDLEVILKQEEAEDDVEDEEGEEGLLDEAKTGEDRFSDTTSEYTPSIGAESNKANSPATSSVSASDLLPSPEPLSPSKPEQTNEHHAKRNLRKRSLENSTDIEQVDTTRNLRNRPAEKRARPDVIALTNTALPDYEKRSSHYNLRAKSKLRAHQDDYFA